MQIPCAIPIPASSLPRAAFVVRSGMEKSQVRRLCIRGRVFKMGCRTASLGAVERRMSSRWNTRVLERGQGCSLKTSYGLFQNYIRGMKKKLHLCGSKPPYRNINCGDKYKIVMTTTARQSRCYCFPTSYADVLTIYHNTCQGGECQATSENNQQCITERERDNCTLRPLRVRIALTKSSSLLPFSSGEPFMTSQWSNTDWGNACPPVAWRRSPLKPNDSITGRYAFTVNIGVPIRCSSENTCPRRLFNTE